MTLSPTARRLRLSIDVRYQPAADKGEAANRRQGHARTLAVDLQQPRPPLEIEQEVVPEELEAPAHAHSAPSKSPGRQGDYCWLPVVAKSHQGITRG